MSARSADARLAGGERSWADARFCPGPLALLLLLTATLASGGCSSPGLEPWPVRELTYPEEPEFDYRPMLAQVHVALPAFDPASGEFLGPARLWLKGSARATSAAVGGAPDVTLAPPYYVAVVDAPPGATIVEFTGEGFHHRVEVVAPDAAQLNAPRAQFSSLAFSCFDPFMVYDGRSGVYAGDGTDEPGRKPDRYSQVWGIRELFRDAARGELPGFPKPDLVCGAGDQVYLEPAHEAYAEFGPLHPLSAWTVEARPRPRVGLAAFVAFVDEAYRRTWSFETLDEVFRSVPAVLVWDDHEIRDGWGSQGDEHVYLDTYYATARDAFVQHQFLRGPRPWQPQLSAPTASLHQSLELHGLPIFVLDERSARDIRVPQVLGDEQWEVFAAWMANLDPVESPYYVLVSPLPLLYRLADSTELAEEFDSEVHDDVLDAWSSDPNTPELDRILAHMLAAWRRGCRALVISGDMHLSGLLRASVLAEGGEAEDVFAYEIVTSGLAGELGGGAWKFHVGREGAVISDPVEIGGDSVKLSLGMASSTPNFSGFEVDQGELVAHLVQALASGPVHYRVPLQWGTGANDFDVMIAKGRRELGRYGSQRAPP